MAADCITGQLLAKGLQIGLVQRNRELLTLTKHVNSSEQGQGW